MFYVGGILQNAYFSSWGNYRVCGQIDHAGIFGDFGPWWYGLGISTEVAFKIQEGQQITSHQRWFFCQMVVQSEPALVSLPWIYVSPPNSPIQEPGVRPVGIGDTWRHLFEKCVMKVTVPKSTNICQYEQLCARLKSGLTAPYTGLRSFGVLIHPQKFYDFYPWMQKTLSTRSIELEWFEPFLVYGHPEIVKF